MRLLIFFAMIVVLCAQSALAAAPPYDVPVWTPGDSYTTTEEHTWDFEPGTSTNFFDFTVQAQRTVAPPETITLASGESFTCMVLRGGGSLTGEGEARDATGAIDNATRVRNGSFIVEEWHDQQTFALVRRRLVFRGDVQYRLFFNWADAGDLDLEIIEEYPQTLPLAQFPLDVGSQWASGGAGQVSGELDMTILGQNPLGNAIPVGGSFTTGGLAAVDGCDTLAVSSSQPNSVAIQSAYCCDAGYFLRQSRSSLPLGEFGELRTNSVTVTAYTRAAGCRRFLTPTPTPSPSPTPTPTVTPTPTAELAPCLQERSLTLAQGWTLVGIDAPLAGGSLASDFIREATLQGAQVGLVAIFEDDSWRVRQAGLPFQDFCVKGGLFVWSEAPATVDIGLDFCAPLCP